jgi:hypothetical protein
MSLNSLKDFLNFQRSRYSGMITCPARPHFESEACTDYFEKRLREATTYLEYGSEGSTVSGVIGTWKLSALVKWLRLSDAWPCSVPMRRTRMRLKSRFNALQQIGAEVQCRSTHMLHA